MAKARKPKPIDFRRRYVDTGAAVHETFDHPVWISSGSLTAAEARRLAAWLIRAAEWIDGREGR